MVQWLTLRVPSYKMKCPSLRKMPRNEEFFGEFDSRRACDPVLPNEMPLGQAETG